MKQNRIISISSRVIEFWCFRLPVALGGRGVGGWVCGVVSGCSQHTCTHTHMHIHTCMHGKHGNFMQMATPIGFGKIPGIPYDVICACVRMHMHVCTCMCR